MRMSPCDLYELRGHFLCVALGRPTTNQPFLESSSSSLSAVSNDEGQQQSEQQNNRTGKTRRQDEEDFGVLTSCVLPCNFFCSALGGDCDCEPMLQACAQHEPLSIDGSAASALH